MSHFKTHRKDILIGSTADSQPADSLEKTNRIELSDGRLDLYHSHQNQLKLLHMTNVVKKDKTNFNKLQKRLRRNMGSAISDYQMIVEGDHIMVCLSGGKDSYTMLDILLNLQQHAPVNFRITAVNLDQKQPGFPEQVLPDYLTAIGVPFYILEKDTYSIVKEKTPEGKTTCALCSRLRRGNLYGFAEKIGANKIALGHHRDDIMETLFLNMFHGGKLKAMPPKLLSDDGKHIVIRPLAYSKESDIARYSELKKFPIIPCNLCGSQENLQRQAVKQMLQGWEKQHPGRLNVIFKSIRNVAPSHLADTQLFDFHSLSNEEARNDMTASADSESLFNDNLEPDQLVKIVNL